MFAMLRKRKFMLLYAVVLVYVVITLTNNIGSFPPKKWVATYDECRPGVSVYAVGGISGNIVVNNVAVVNETTSSRGINVVVVSRRTGIIIDEQSFDTYISDVGWSEYVSTLGMDSMVILVTQDDASMNMRDAGRAAAYKLGSVRVGVLNFRGSWVLVGSLDPSFHIIESMEMGNRYKYGEDAVVSACIPLMGTHEPEKETKVSRREFCARHKGYKELCLAMGNVDLPLLPAPVDPISNLSNEASNLPIIILSGNRPLFLSRSLLSLFKCPGLKPELITIYLDGFDDESRIVAELFNVTVIQHSKGVSSSDMSPTFRNADIIAMHYKTSLEHHFFHNSKSDVAIILEEDLEVASDLLTYFSQLLPALRTDPSVLCVSAWNDNAYTYSSYDPSLIYRVHLFPGLGWMLTRDLWNELRATWPSCCYGHSWDIWLRGNETTKGRDCLVPDVPRTYHIGDIGKNVNVHFFKTYFLQHAINKKTNVRLTGLDRLTITKYDEDLLSLIKQADPLNTATLDSATLCYGDFIPNYATNKVFVIFYAQKDINDLFNMEKILTCFRLWDLGVRGVYKTVLRFHIGSNQVLAVGEKSHFAANIKDIVPIDFQTVKYIMPNRS